MSEDSLSCILVDDHPAILDSVGRYLAANGVEVVGTAQNSAEGLALLESKRPTVALFDIGMPGTGGIELMRRAAGSALRDTAVIVYTGSIDAALLTEALDAGARGYVLKE